MTASWPETDLAAIVDSFVLESEYEKSVGTALELCRRSGFPGPGQALDVGCGTGRAAEKLCGLGWQLIGIDRSPEMLTLASQRLSSFEPPPLLIHQDTRRLELGAVRCELALAVGGVLNHLRRTRDLVEVLTRVARALRPGGLLLLDVLTPDTAVDGVDEWERADVLLVCESDWHPLTHVGRVTYDVFVTESRGSAGTSLWRRMTDSRLIRSYGEAEMREAILQAGFAKLLGPLYVTDRSPYGRRVVFAAQVGEEEITLGC